MKFQIALCLALCAVAFARPSMKGGKGKAMGGDMVDKKDDWMMMGGKDKDDMVKGVLNFGGFVASMKRKGKGKGKKGPKGPKGKKGKGPKNDSDDVDRPDPSERPTTPSDRPDMTRDPSDRPTIPGDRPSSRSPQPRPTENPEPETPETPRRPEPPTEIVD